MVEKCVSKNLGETNSQLMVVFSDIMKIIEDISMVRPPFLQTAPGSSSSPSPEIPLLWPQQCHLHHPPVITKITIFIGGINLPFPVMGGLWHCFARISCCLLQYPYVCLHHFAAYLSIVILLLYLHKLALLGSTSIVKYRLNRIALREHVEHFWINTFASTQLGFPQGFLQSVVPSFPSLLKSQ